MTKASKSLIAVALVFAVPSAQAYPLFYKCDASGRMSDELDTRDIAKAVRAATSDENTLEQKLVDLCANKQECMSILKQMLILTQSTVAAVNRLLQEAIEKMEAKLDGLNEKIDSDLPETAQKVIAASNEIYACRKAQEGLGDGLYTYKDRGAIKGQTTGYDMFIHHRVDNEYSQFDGVKRLNKDGEDKSHRVDYDEIGTVINDAVAADTDPYMALAISFMEAGKPQRFQLDPSALLDMVACPHEVIKRVDHNNREQRARVEAELRAAGTPFVYSFGSFHRITPGIRERVDVSRQMLDQKEYYDSEAELAPALACKQAGNTFFATPGGEITQIMKAKVVAPDLSVKKACCTRIPYASEEFFAAASSVFLRGKMAGASPEMALQKFNGTGIIGISERDNVGSFRYGIDMGEDPQYGYQGMDAVLNDFMSNSTIRYMVEQAKTEFGKNPKSLLCLGKAAGAYAIDSDYYLRKQKDIVRLKPFIGKSWAALGPNMKASMTTEMDRAASWIGKGHIKLSTDENARFQAGLAKMEAAGGESARWEIFKREVYPYRKTLYQTSDMSWKRLTNQETADRRGKILAAPPQE